MEYRMNLGVIAACAALGLAVADEPVTERIVLKNGVRMEGVVSESNAESVTLDLGFTKLVLPAGEIAGRQSAATGVQKLWHDTPGLTQRSLDENVKACGEAVVLVRTPVGLGSGFVIQDEGYLVTNDHVIEGSNELTIVVYRKATDGLRKDEYKKIRIVAMSELLDLALLKIETEPAEKFVTVPLGESAALVQGDPVFAIGNPMGLERTLSEGIVGVRSRLLGGQTYVQTTAPISPGNSGGPLFNRKGEVIGVNTLKVVSMGAEGLGFSIPIDRVKAFLADQEAFAFDPLNANTGFRYYPPPGNGDAPAPPAKSDS
jgi:serine protease Do